MGALLKVAVTVEYAVKPIPEIVAAVPARPNAGKIDIDGWDDLPKAQR